MKRLSKMQIEVTIKPVENNISPVKDPAKNPAVDPVRGHDGNLTENVQLQPQQNKDLTRSVQPQPQQDVYAIEVDVSKVSDPHVIKVVTIIGTDKLSCDPNLE